MTSKSELYGDQRLAFIAALRDAALAIATSGSAHIGYLMAQGERFLARVLPASDTAPTGALAMVVPLAPYVEQLKAKLVKQNAKSAPKPKAAKAEKPKNPPKAAAKKPRPAARRKSGLVSQKSHPHTRVNGPKAPPSKT